MVTGSGVGRLAGRASADWLAVLDVQMVRVFRVRERSGSPDG